MIGPKKSICSEPVKNHIGEVGPVRIVKAVLLVLFMILSMPAFGQNQLDPRPYDPEKDPDIDMFMNSWKNSIPFNSHGNLTERVILTRWDGDPLKPEKKGECLQFVNRLTRATLDPGASTTPTTLKGEQEIFYVMSGTGTVKGGSKTAELRKGALFVVPEGLEFTMRNTGGESLVMYLINEPIPEGYEPETEIAINYEDQMPLRSEGFIKVHWSHNGRGGIRGATLSVGRLIYNAMTIGQPHSHGPDYEEVWMVTEGKNLAWLGKEIRWQYPGTAYRIPPSGFTPHTNINTTEEPLRFLIYIAQSQEK